MKVRDLIQLLGREDADADVLICADNGTEADPADLTSEHIRMVSEGPDNEDGSKTVGVWAEWGTFIAAEQEK